MRCLQTCTSIKTVLVLLSLHLTVSVSLCVRFRSKCNIIPFITAYRRYRSRSQWCIVVIIIAMPLLIPSWFSILYFPLVIPACSPTLTHLAHPLRNAFHLKFIENTRIMSLIVCSSTWVWIPSIRILSAYACVMSQYTLDATELCAADALHLVPFSSWLDSHQTDYMAFAEFVFDIVVAAFFGFAS